MASSTPQKSAPTPKIPVQEVAASAFKTPVILRSNFYRDNYRRLMVFCLLLIFITFGLMAWLFYERTHKLPFQFYATTNDGKLIRLTPLNQPNLTTPALLDWVIEATTTAYNFNFDNYDQALKDVHVYFTEAGYEHFISALNAAGTIEAVKAKRLVVFAVATNTPVILNEGPSPEGIYAWQIQVPMLITYQSASEVTKQNVVMTLLVARRPTLESPKGIGIAAMTIKET